MLRHVLTKYSFCMIAIVALVTSAYAAPVTYEFIGTVGFALNPQIPLGAPVQFSLNYDSTWTLLPPIAINERDFAIPFPPASVIGAIGGTAFEARGTGVARLVVNAGVNYGLIQCQLCDSLELMIGTSDHQKS